MATGCSVSPSATSGGKGEPIIHCAGQILLAETFSDTYTVPATLPPHFQQAGVKLLCRRVHRDRHPAGKQLAHGHRQRLGEHFIPRWDDCPAARALFGRRPQPSTRKLLGIDRKRSLKSLKTNFRDTHDIIIMPGVGHTPPEERDLKRSIPILLKFPKNTGTRKFLRAARNRLSWCKIPGHTCHIGLRDGDG